MRAHILFVWKFISHAVSPLLRWIGGLYGILGALSVMKELLPPPLSDLHFWNFLPRWPAAIWFVVFMIVVVLAVIEAAYSEYRLAEARNDHRAVLTSRGERWIQPRPSLNASAIAIGVISIASIVISWVYAGIQHPTQLAQSPPTTARADSQLKGSPTDRRHNSAAIAEPNAPEKTPQIRQRRQIDRESTQIINNAPGGIAISGGNVINPTVNNFRPAVMTVLSIEQRALIAERMAAYKGSQISIEVNEPTDDMLAFANSLKEALAHQITTVSMAHFLGGCSTNPPGISFMVGINREKQARLLWDALVELGLQDGPMKYCTRPGEPDELHVRIFRP